MVVTLWGHLDVPEDRLTAVLDALPRHVALTRAEAGCLHFAVTQSPDLPSRLLVAETFADEESFAAHQARTVSSAWAEATHGIERHYHVTRLPEAVLARVALEGAESRQWLVQLPSVILSLERDWGLTIGEALPGGTAGFVAEAIDAEGNAFIVKLVTPPGPGGRHEASLLAMARGKGYVRLLQHDAGRHAMRLEKLGDSLATLDLPYRSKADHICATLLEAWMPVPPGIAWQNGAEKANDLGRFITTTAHALGQPCAPAVIERALLYCRDRAAAWRPESAVLAHGDPHAANTLSVPGMADQFRFIDPEGLAIEPAYDLGVVLRGWHEGIAGPHAHDIARSHARHLTTRSQVPAEAIWQWGYIERVSTGLHLLELGQRDEGLTFLGIADAIERSA